MNKRTRRWLRVLWIAVLVIVIIYGIGAINLYSSIGRFPTGVPRPAPHIRNLIWPTVGYPELVRAGATLSAEFEASGLDRNAAFTATLTPVRPELAGLSYKLASTGSTPGGSEHWPAGTSHGGDTVWRVRFALPASAVPELYNLSVAAAGGAVKVTDSQEHSVSIRPAGAGKDFTFLTLADIHVHRLNISMPLDPQTNKGISPDGTPVFFQRAIEQVNLVRPDFVLILGDNIRAQHAPGDYQIEFAEFYKTLAQFEVPVFIIPGNHDSYYNEVDGLKVYEENIGPLFYSFDVEDSHFSMVNTSQWPDTDRMLMQKFGTFVYPRKWQGQVLGATDERKPQTYAGELAWLRNDLIASTESHHKFIAMHHDPFRPNGRGISWKNERFAGLYALGGGGRGSMALKELAARYRVNYVMTGHLHSDYIGAAKWRDGKGSTVYANQTMVYFDEGGMKMSYPGYRNWDVRASGVTGYTYQDAFHSTPLYDGSVLNGETDLDHLDIPALSSSATPTGFTVKNYLGAPEGLRGLVGVFPARSAYSINGGAAYQAVPMPSDPTRAVVYVESFVPAGRPGQNSTTPGAPATKTVTVD